MKFLRWAAVAAVFAVPASRVLAQQTSPPVANPSPAADPGEAPEPHQGKVIFSRSLEDGASATPAEKTAEASTSDDGANDDGKGDDARDAERQAITFLSYDLDVHLQPREHAMAVRARIQVRNDSDEPVQRLPLQISSSLRWISVRIADASAAFSQHLIKSDADHTGALHEAVISLVQPLAPHQTIALDVTYDGTAGLNADRLEQIGTPAEAAETSDWDRVSEEFVGLRGFGNVAWYPIASVPVALGDGAKFFAESAAQRQRQSQTMVSMSVTEEFFGEAPNLAVLNGQALSVTPTSLPGTASIPGIVTCSLPATRLGFASPSLFLLTRTPQKGNGITVYARPDDRESAQAYLSAAAVVAPLIHLWLGEKPLGDLSVVDLPESGDASFEDGAVLFTSVGTASNDKLANILVHSLTHVYFRSHYPWLQEGVASFMGSLWLEKSRGRDFAILQMDNERAALSLAEPGDSLPDSASPTSAPGKVSSESNDLKALRVARDPVFYRTKATYVFWMLRDLAGDGSLSHALRAYQPGADLSGNEFEELLERESAQDLKWFFENWVNHDRGLPDFSIAGVYPNKAGLPGAYIVAVDVLNSGTAAAEVPVSVSSGTVTVTERLWVPAKSKINHRFLVQGQPAEVTVNDGSVPEVQSSVHRQTLAVP